MSCIESIQESRDCSFEEREMSSTVQQPGFDAERSCFISYEQRLNQDSTWAMSEGSLFFQDQGAVQQAMRRITGRLEELGIPYAIVGGMALFQHGYRRFTEDVDILVTRESLRRIHEKLDGRGYLAPFLGSKNLCDAELGVRIEFFIAGGFPGDGKPKPVSFPDPSAVAIEMDGRKYVPLATLIEMKLASGMTDMSRLKDLADVQEVVKSMKLPIEFADRLNPYVRDRFRELWSPGEQEE
jgi:hypothetical protein